VIVGVVVLGGAAGALLAFRRFKVRVTGEAIAVTIIDFLVSVSSLHFGYLVGSIANGFFMVAKPPDKVLELLHVVRTSIGQELQVVFELPRDLPPEMVTVLARLDDLDECVGAGNNFRA
jgi:hypothetical protein